MPIRLNSHEWGWRRVLRSEDGAATTTFLLTMVPVFVLLVGMTFDFAQAYGEQTHALNVAEQAARAGAQQIDLAAVRDSGTYRLDEGRAASEATSFLSAAGYPADSVLVDVDSVEVTTSWTSPVAFLSIIGIPPFEGEASASASMEVGVASGGP
jgi:Flp pilus assembly protein TadG